MKSFEIIDTFGDTIVVEPELGLYTAHDYMGIKMPVLGIQLYSYDEDGEREPYSTLTVNFGEFIGAKDCTYIDTNNNSFTAQLLNKGFCQDTGFTKQSGFCTYPLWKFDADFLREIDVHRLYDEYSDRFDKYMRGELALSVADREGEILADVMFNLGLFGQGYNFTFDSDGLYATSDDGVYYGADFYKHLLSKVCEFDENGVVKGLDLSLCHDFYDLCEHNGVDYKEYNTPNAEKQTEFVITMSSGGGTVRDFLTCETRQEAEDVCKNYDWVFVDENAFEWSLEIDEREVSLETTLADAFERSEKTDTGITGKDDIIKD